MRALARRLAALLMRFGTYGEWFITIRSSCDECAGPASVTRVDLLAAMVAGEAESAPRGQLN